MTKLANYGYKTKEIKYRTLSLAELIIAISGEMFANDDEDKECRFVWLDTAEVVKIDGVKGLHTYPFNITAIVRVYSFAAVHDGSKWYYKVVLEDTGF